MIKIYDFGLRYERLSFSVSFLGSCVVKLSTYDESIDQCDYKKDVDVRVLLFSRYDGKRLLFEYIFNSLNFDLIFKIHNSGSHGYDTDIPYNMVGFIYFVYLIYVYIKQSFLNIFSFASFGSVSAFESVVHTLTFENIYNSAWPASNITDNSCCYAIESLLKT